MYCIVLYCINSLNELVTKEIIICCVQSTAVQCIGVALALYRYRTGGQQTGPTLTLNTLHGLCNLTDIGTDDRPWLHVLVDRSASPTPHIFCFVGMMVPTVPLSLINLTGAVASPLIQVPQDIN